MLNTRNFANLDFTGKSVTELQNMKSEMELRPYSLRSPAQQRAILDLSSEIAKRTRAAEGRDFTRKDAPGDCDQAHNWRGMHGTTPKNFR